MSKINVAIFGASNRCIALAARVLKNNVNVKVFFDNDEKKIGRVKEGWRYIEENKVWVPYNNVAIDVPMNYAKYEFEYIIVLVGRKDEIREQLIKIGIREDKIIVYGRTLSNGIIEIPEMSVGGSLKSLLDKAAEKGFSKSRYVEEAKNLLEVSRKMFNSKYRLAVLEILVTALKASVENEIIEYKGVRLNNLTFSINPTLFLYESSDILVDIIDEEMNDIEFVEGPYSSFGVEVNEDDVVFDFGANFGLFSGIAATKAPKGKIYAFEPVSKAREILRGTAELYDNIIVIPYAISDMCGKTQIDISGYEDNQGGASIMNGMCGGVTEEIETISLDQFVKEWQIEKVDFIKADIEGAERLLLMGAKETLKKFAPKIAICTYHNDEDTVLLEELIKESNPNYIVEKAYMKLYAYVKER